MNLQIFQPDMLLSDIGLHVENGYDLIQRVRALPSATSGIPAVALTAFASETHRQRELASGFQIHLAKPVEPASLIQTIDPLVQCKGDRSWAYSEIAVSFSLRYESDSRLRRSLSSPKAAAIR